MAPSKKKYGLNPEPRLSANQLAEYLIASPTRRKSIVKEAKFPKTLLVARYDAARTGVSNFLADPMRKIAILVEALDALKERENKAAATTWVKDDCRLSAEAIKAFQKLYGNLGLGKLDCKSVVTKQPKLSFNNVEISVSLDITTHCPKNGGGDSVGGIIILLSKTEQSTSARIERCKTSAVLAAMFAGEHLGYLGTPDPKICFALDIFGGRLVKAPATYKMKADNIAESCEEVALRWPGTLPPDDYDGPPI